MEELKRAYVILSDEGPEAECDEANRLNRAGDGSADYIADFDVTELMADALAWRTLNNECGVAEEVVHLESMRRLAKLLSERSISILAELASLRLARLMDVASS